MTIKIAFFGCDTFRLDRFPLTKERRGGDGMMGTRGEEKGQERVLAR